MIRSITLVAGARPNFIKIAPIVHAILKRQSCGRLGYRLVHTGQHYDQAMSETFFKELNIPEPHANLNCGGGSQAEQTAAIMVAFEKDLVRNPTDLVLVVGDVTSTLACAIVAKKLNIKVAHVEAGIRSFDLSMPEEINRMVTDSISDYFFTTTQWATSNLIRSGVSANNIFFVGNVMIDTLLANMSRLRRPALWLTHNLESQQYFLVTLHRPANVDDADKLRILLKEIRRNTRGLPVIFPVHPRTKKALTELEYSNSLITTDPLGYLEFIFLAKNAKAIITDSGGVTEEATVMGIPCLTLRSSTERPETCEVGTNELIGEDPVAIKPALERLFSGSWKKGSIPDKWDGNTSERIVDALLRIN